MGRPVAWLREHLSAAELTEHLADWLLPGIGEPDDEADNEKTADDFFGMLAKQ